MKICLAALMALSISACSTLMPTKVTVYPEAGTLVTSQKAALAFSPTPVTMLTHRVEIPLATAPELIPTEVAARPHFSQADIECLSLAVYHEARGESKQGQAAVAWVVMNRVNSGKFPSSICGVVRQTKNGCQFSWYCDRKSDVPTDKAAYTRSMEVALAVLAREYPNPVGNALFFDGFVHKKQVATRSHVQIGKHRFFASYGRNRQ